MKPNTQKDYPSRSHPSRGVHLYSFDACVVFLTITTRDRHRWLASHEAHRAIRMVWFSATAWLVGRYLLMPDHLHLLCAPRDRSCEIENWIGFWKRKFSREHKNPHWKFQPAGWHHRLRHDESREERWHYIRNNPVRAGLVNQPAERPFQGKIFDI